MGISLCSCTVFTNMNSPTFLVGGTSPRGGASRRQDLATLRAQLQAELGRVEAAVAAQEAPRAPGTLQEIEALEQRLKEAMDELQARKQELQQREREGGAGPGPDKPQGTP